MEKITSFSRRHANTLWEISATIIVWLLLERRGTAVSLPFGSGLIAASLLWPRSETSKWTAFILDLIKRIAGSAGLIFLLAIFSSVGNGEKILGAVWCISPFVALLQKWLRTVVITASRFQKIRSIITAGSFAAADTLSESLVLAIVFTLAGRLWQECWHPHFLLVSWFGFVGLGAIFHRHSRKSYVAVLAAKLAALVVGMAIGLVVTGVPLQRGHSAVAVLGSLSFLLYGWVAERFTSIGDGKQERLRVSLCMASAFWLLNPIAYPTCHGSGDAAWYGMMLADMISQVRAGVFPVFGGQSLYQFNGSIYPLRIAPAFHYLGTAFDFLTLRSLTAFAIQNLLLVGWGVIAGVTSYIGLTRLLPNHRWWGLFGSVIFLCCPGVICIAYLTDLYMSWMTVPFVPLCMVANALLFGNPRPKYYLLLGTTLGLLWWGHTPIALWTTVITIGLQLVRIICAKNLLQTWKSSALAAVIFAVVAAFPVGAALLYPPDPAANVSGFQVATANNVLRFVQEAFFRSLLPLDSHSPSLSWFQLGYSLWIALVVGIWAAIKGRNLGGRVLLGVAVGLVVLLVPIPFVTHALWSLIPGFIRNTTGNWVMNRLYLLLASSVIVGTTVALVSYCFRRDMKMNSWWRASALLLCAWSMSQVYQIHLYSNGSRREAKTAKTMLLPENIVITRFAYLVFPQMPGYFSHGVVDPELEQRFYSDDHQLRWTNTSLILDALKRKDAHVSSMNLAGFEPVDSEHSVWRIPGTVRIEPGKRYLLNFDFHGEQPSGVLQLVGNSLFREYELPQYGGAASFGSPAEANKTIAVWSSEAAGDSIEIRFVPRIKENSGLKTSIQLIQYSREILRAKVLSWIPYRVQIDWPEPGWLETPRSYQTYWETNGNTAGVKKSPEGLAMIRHEPSDSIHELHYKVPLGFTALFWTALVVAVTSIVTLGRRDVQWEMRFMQRVPPRPPDTISPNAAMG